GSKRFLFGWNPTKRDNRDEGLWEWGGNLVVHELKQRPDGSLAQVMPEGYRDQFTQLLYVHDAFIGKQGKATFSPIHIPYPETYLLQTSIVFDRDVSHAGIALRFDAETDDSYWYIIEPRSNRLVFDRFPNDAWHFMNFHGLEKYTPLIPGSTVQIEIIVDGDIAVCYLNQKAVLSTRMHLNPGKPLALVSINGRTRFEELKIFTLGGRS
ncbi:MAG: hypothetical protein PHO96_04820, partial [Candidatus Izemoplasmatales bacterium]|nr:hypothetical protein [Candidatus Izemoplasmatales bacterium]